MLCSYDAKINVHVVSKLGSGEHSNIGAMELILAQYKVNRFKEG